MKQRKLPPLFLTASCLPAVTPEAPRRGLRVVCKGSLFLAMPVRCVGSFFPAPAERLQLERLAATVGVAAALRRFATLAAQPVAHPLMTKMVVQLAAEALRQGFQHAQSEEEEYGEDRLQALPRLLAATIPALGWGGEVPTFSDALHSFVLHNFDLEGRTRSGQVPFKQPHPRGQDGAHFHEYYPKLDPDGGACNCEPGAPAPTIVYDWTSLSLDLAAFLPGLAPAIEAAVAGRSRLPLEAWSLLLSLVPTHPLGEDLEGWQGTVRDWALLKRFFQNCFHHLELRGTPFDMAL